MSGWEQLDQYMEDNEGTQCLNTVTVPGMYAYERLPTTSITIINPILLISHQKCHVFKFHFIHD
jgi:hypothetical protein